MSSGSVLSSVPARGWSSQTQVKTAPLCPQASPFTHLTHGEEENSPRTLAFGWPLKVQCVKTKEALWRAQGVEGLSPQLPTLLLP